MIPAAAMAEVRSPAGASGSLLSEQKIPYIHPSSCFVRRISQTFVSSGYRSGSCTGYSHKRKLSIPLGLSAMAKNDLRSCPSTRAITRYFPLNLIAPALNTALMPKRSIRQGFVSGLKSYLHSSGGCSAVRMGYLYRSKTPLPGSIFSFSREMSSSYSFVRICSLLSYLFISIHKIRVKHRLAILFVLLDRTKETVCKPDIPEIYGVVGTVSLYFCHFESMGVLSKNTCVKSINYCLVII